MTISVTSDKMMIAVQKCIILALFVEQYKKEKRNALLM